MNDGTVGLERQLFLEQEISHGLLRRAKKAEQTIDRISNIKSRTFKSLNTVPVGLPANERWVKLDDLQAIIGGKS